MTPRELAICQALKDVSFPPGTAKKRFARDMIFHAEHYAEKPLTEKQARYLTAIAYTFRRQMPAHLAYPIVDDGSAMAARGFEAVEPKAVTRRILPEKVIRQSRRVQQQAIAQRQLCLI
jgi:hypothetical protein